MQWFYVENGQQRGPIDQVALDQLFKAQTIRADTLVWREGLTDWIPYSQMSGSTGGQSSSMPMAGAANEVVCHECNRIFSKDQVIQHSGRYVCAGCKPVFMQKLKEGALSESVGGLNYAGFWPRFCAYFLDQVILNVVSLGIGFALGAAAATQGMNVDIVSLVATGISLVLSVAYYTFFVGRMGATPGKMALKLRVVRPDGSPIGYGRAAGRMFAYFLSSIICLLGFIMAAFDDERRALHDRICGTRVVKV